MNKEQIAHFNELKNKSEEIITKLTKLNKHALAIRIRKIISKYRYRLTTTYRVGFHKLEDSIKEIRIIIEYNKDETMYAVFDEIEDLLDTVDAYLIIEKLEEI